MKHILALLLPLALLAQPQSPNFVLISETFSANSARDSSQNFVLRSVVGQLSDAGIAASPNFVVKSGFLAPVFEARIPILVIDRDTVDFGGVWISIAVEDEITIQNTGNADLVVDSVHSAHPLISSVTTPVTIPAGQSHEISVVVTVPDTLLYEGVLTAYSNAGQDSVFVTVSGIWTDLSVNPQSADMGIIAVGDSADAELELISAGNTGLSITDITFTANHFVMPQEPELTLGAYDTTSLIVRFHAVTSGVYLDTLVISHSVGEELRIPLAAGATAAADHDAQIPTVFFMDQNYPNPFNPSTTIRFGVPRAAEVTIGVYDVLGRLTGRLVSGRFEAGYHSLSWNCADCSAGLYFARMISPDITITRKLMLLK